MQQRLSTPAPNAGTRRAQYLAENVGAADVALSQEDLKALEEAFPHGQVGPPRQYST
jgi:aryl-alcohol dehydrogenase-like predicted oxidoreductase